MSPPETTTRPPLVRIFHAVAIAEGLSFLLLLGIAMPLKYMAGMPAAVHWVGSIHGFLFVAYVALAGGLFTVAGWPIGRLPWVMLASVLPFGTFVLERKWLR
jgi:integral membrane protein